MSQTVATVREWRAGDGRTVKMLYVWCPGCDHLHGVEIEEEGRRWQWNGDLAKPTVEPSILVNPSPPALPGRRCHSFLRDGMWQFLGDSDHDLAGKAAPMVPLPAWMVKEDTTAR